jgi:hypothetical protein
VKCPTCRHDSAPARENRFFPFCSERCKLVDLSRWLSEDYRIPGPPAIDDDDGASQVSAERPRGEGGDDDPNVH